MKHSVCVVTGSRAEFGLLLPLLRKIGADEQLELRLVVTGSHLSRSFGNTQGEIEESGVTIHFRIPVPLDGDSKAEMVRATGTAMSAFSDYFTEHRPELLVVLGDRYELFAASAAAAMMGISVAHLYGGETTEGAVDEFLRHSITKMSYLHFAACEEYRYRVIQLGESPDRVFNVGALGIENILKMPLLTREELENSIGFDLSGQPYSVVTFHPVTLEDNTAEGQLLELISAMDEFPDIRYIITKANADAGGRRINQLWDEEAKTRENWLVVPSLGVQRYLSALKYAQMMLGNSSSGIIEAPAMHIPTVNIGDRQKGRMMADSIICCEPKRGSIVAAMKEALTPEFKSVASRTVCPFGNGDTTERVLVEIKSFVKGTVHDTKKKFYDLRPGQ